MASTRDSHSYAVSILRSNVYVQYVNVESAMNAGYESRNVQKNVQYACSANSWAKNANIAPKSPEVL